MNRKGKGTRREHQSRDLLEALGYDVTRAGGSLGVFDLVAIGWSNIRLVQVKCNRMASPGEREEIEAARCPPNGTKEIWVWKDRATLPEVSVWNGKGWYERMER